MNYYRLDLPTYKQTLDSLHFQTRDLEMNTGCGPQTPEHVSSIISVIRNHMRDITITISPDFLKNFVSIRFYLNKFLGQKESNNIHIYPHFGGFPQTFSFLDSQGVLFEKIVFYPN